jgi:hypothetical protein
MPVLEGLPPEAFQGELRRMLAHSENPDMKFVDDLSRFTEIHGSLPLGDFVTLCQSASFITRGRD